jgi:tetratricopeptide (TPR) repeat protein
LPGRNVAFAGRDALLGKLRQRLREEGSAAVLPAQALHGLGGVGKTQLALEYAYRYQADYDLIWWIVAEAPGAIPAALAELASQLALVQDAMQVADQERLVAVVLEALRRRERWLLVFDNVPDRQQVAPYLPQGHGHVLITSRYPVWGGIAEAIKVDTFTRPESIAFLTQRTGTHDETSTTALAEELGDLPLALEQASAYLEETGMPLAEYLELFRRRREELLKLGEPTAYRGTVDTTWQLTIEQVATIKPGGKGGIALLRLCAFLAPEAIPLDLLTGHSDLLYAKLGRAARDELALQNAVAAVYRYSLVDRDEAGLRAHRLVQAVVRNRLTPRERGAWAELAVSLVDAAFPAEPDEPLNWPRCAQLIPHVLAAAEHAGVQQVALEAATPLLDNAARYLWKRGELRAALVAQKQALAIGEAVYGPDDPRVALTLTNLGIVLGELEEFAEARVVLERALATLEASYGPESPEVATTLSNLGLILRNLGELPAARVVLERALAILEAVRGSFVPEVAMVLSGLGDVLRMLGELPAARMAQKRALAILEAVLGSDHPEVAMVLGNLGLSLRGLGELAEARVVLERALAIFEASYGSDHVKVAFTLRHLVRPVSWR